jgi:chitinase
MKKIPLHLTTIGISTFVIPFIILLTTISALAASVSLQWDPNDPTPEGYRVFARRSDQVYNYSQPDWEGSTATCTIDTLEDQTEYYFVVRAYDGSLESADSEEAHLIAAPPANQPPVSIDDNFTVDEGGTLTIAAAGGVIANDSDPDGDTLSASLAGGVSHGSLAFSSDGSFTYIHDSTDTVADGFSYTLSDGQGNTDTGSVSITIQPVNDTTPPPTDPDPDNTTPPASTDPDTDNDGTPDSADLDTDDDGMPNDWETLFGLNPMVDDAAGDLDQDGINNRDEYRAGLEPDDPGMGTAPQQPAASSPASNAQVERNPLLKLEAYSDADGDAHIATQWQVYDTSSDDCLLDVVSDRRLNQLRVPFLLLNGNRTYHWRVRFFDSGGRASQWSTVSYLVTDEAADDLNGNGIPDDQEGGDLQADVSRSLSSPTVDCEPTNIVVDSEDTISEIEQVVLLDPAEFEIDESTPAQLPSAMLAYKLVLQQPGQRALVTIQLSDAAPVGSTWLKYDAVNGWQDYSDHTVFSPDGSSVTVEIKDGDYGDADGVANGIIVDPAGLSAAAVSTSPTTTEAGAGGGGGGGCFISTIHDGENETPARGGPWQWLKGNMNRLMGIFAN